MVDIAARAPGAMMLAEWPWNIPASEPGLCLKIKTVFPRDGDSHVKDKTVIRQSYL